MKTIWVATLHAGAFNYRPYFRRKIQESIIYFLIVLGVIACNTNDDLDENVIIEEPPVAEEPPVENEPPEEEESVILFTNLDPDYTAQGVTDTFQLDLNNDETIDFTISWHSSDGWDLLLITAEQANGVLSVHPWYTHPSPLKSGDKIYHQTIYRNGESYDRKAIFSIGPCFSGSTEECYSIWPLKQDTYLGVRISLNGKIHYGWILMHFDSLTEWMVKEYAFNATPNKPILAGQKK
ncbi:hypothetical protein E0K83_10095 [Gramella sp. BOM4]|nr:hypothetical protein [Christiangramia bathymodioli]